MNNSNTSNLLDLSVVIPVFNEENNLTILHDRLTAVIQSLGKTYEIVYVDDGSSDNSFRILRDLNGYDDRARVIQLTRNFGQIPAIMAGFAAARGEIIITMDADLQNPPEEIPKFINKIENGYEIVFGVFQQRKHSAFRRAGSWFTKWVLARILPVEETSLSGFKAMRSYVVDQLVKINDKSRFLSGLLCWMGYKVGTIEVKHDDRYSGRTKYSTFKLVAQWLNMVVAFTALPLKIATFAGLFLGLCSLALTVFYVIRYFMYGFGVSGFATIVILITFFSGVQLFSLGILGEYIGRMNKEIKNRPEYIIRETIG